jgi:hypothetical protein
LFRWPLTETDVGHIAEPPNVPDPLDTRTMARAVDAARHDPDVFDDYGPGSSILLSRPDPDPDRPAVPIELAEICVCDLRDVPGGWAHENTLDQSVIAIDPHLGRVVIGSGVEGPIRATFHWGFSRPMGGGEYERELDGASLAAQRMVSGGQALQPHLDQLAAGGRLIIQDSLTYAETPLFTVNGPTAGDVGVEVVVTARNGARPLIAAGGSVLMDIGPRGRLVLEGLVISGGDLQLVADADEEPRTLILRHCTLVPGLALNGDGTAVAPGAPSLTIGHPFASVRLEHCIVGGLQIETTAAVELSDCIVDAGSSSGVALVGSATDRYGAELTIRDSTVIGKVRTRLMRLASDTIFFSMLAEADPWKAPVWVDRKQEGCVRFSFVPEGSLVPRRFRCVPGAEHPDVRPHFTSLRYGDPGYAQLRRATDASIRSGAHDEGEMGAMHALYQPQREKNLRIRLDEYLRFGLHAGIFYAT